MIRSRLFVAVLSVTALVAPLWSAAPASANKPTQIFERSVHFVCSDVRTPDGIVQIAADDFSEFDTPDASINYWVPPETPENAPDSTYRSSSLIEDQQVTRDGLHFEGTVVMEDRDFNPVGNATFSVDLIPTSDVESVGEKSKFGNRNIHDKSTVQFFSVSGSVTLHDGKTFDLTNCIGPDGADPEKAAADFITDIRVTDPSQFVLNKSGILVLCDVVTDSYAMSFGASSESTGTSGQAQFFSDAQSIGGGTDSGLTLTNEVLSGAIPIEDFDTGESLGDAIVDVTFTRGQHAEIRTTQGSIRDTMVGFLLNPTGTITFPTDPATAVDMSSCFAFDGREQQKEHRPRA
ncbi:MAG: hypothetical protein WAT66_12945 [Actinomycetota bacterium]